MNNNAVITSRKARRIQERKEAKLNKQRVLSKRLVAVAVAGTLGATGATGATAAVAAPMAGSSFAQTVTASKSSQITAPTLAGLSLEKKSLTAAFLTDAVNPSPEFSVEVIPEEDSSALPALKQKLAKTKERYEELKAGIEAQQDLFNTWQAISWETYPDKTTVFLSNGETERMPSSVLRCLCEPRILQRLTSSTSRASGLVKPTSL